MDDVALYSLSNMTNASAAMFERRRRILDEARKLIGQGGLEGFNVRELCRRAGVAQRTLYYAFDNKDNIIALAIGTYFEEFERRLAFDKQPLTFENALLQQITTTLRNHQIPNYLKAVSALYFSPTLPRPVRSVLLEIGGKAWKPWLSNLVIHRQLAKPVHADTLLVDLSNLQFAKVHEWGLGNLSGDEFLDQSVEAVLIHLAGAVKGPALKTVRQGLASWSEVPEDKAALIAKAKAMLQLISPDRDGQKRSASKPHD